MPTVPLATPAHVPGSEPFYERTGPGAYRATAHTAGPWSPDHQHGGPVSALLLRVLTAEDPLRTGALARIVVDLLRPVRLGDLAVRSEVIRTGRRVALVEATLVQADRVAARAAAWFVRRRPDQLELPPAPDAVAPVGPHGLLDTVPANDLEQALHRGYMASMAWRFASGGWSVPGDALLWAQPRRPLVDDAVVTVEEAVLLLADSAGGAGGRLDLREHLFINNDLVVGLSRPPHPGWVGMHVTTSTSPAGMGLCSGTLFDEDGPVGRLVQSQLVAPHDGT